MRIPVRCASGLQALENRLSPSGTSARAAGRTTHGGDGATAAALQPACFFPQAPLPAPQAAQLRAAMVPLRGLPPRPPAWRQLSGAAAEAAGSRNGSAAAAAVVAEALAWRRHLVPDVEGASGASISLIINSMYVLHVDLQGEILSHCKWYCRKRLDVVPLD